MSADKSSIRTDVLCRACESIFACRAYWVSDIRARKAGYADTDLTSHGCGVDQPVLATSNDAGAEPVPWHSTEQIATSVKHLPAEALLEGTLRNVASETIDLGAACLGKRFAYKITSDGPATLRLSDGRSIALHEGVNEAAG